MKQEIGERVQHALSVSSADNENNRCKPWERQAIKAPTNLDPDTAAGYRDAETSDESDMLFLTCCGP